MPATPSPPATTPPGPATPETAPPGGTIRISTPAQLIAAVPCLLGHQPGQDMVIIGTTPTATAEVTIRYSLPRPADTAGTGLLARHALTVLNAGGCQTAVAVGYGPEETVTPLFTRLREQAAQHQVRFTSMLRVTGQRYWSCTCTSPACCPPEGTVWEPAPVPVRASRRALGISGPLASREELAQAIAAVTGPEADAMTRATRNAQRRAARIAANAAASGQDPHRAVTLAGIQAVKEAIGAYRQGGSTITCAQAGRLTLALAEIRVRDEAWCRMESAHRNAHLRLMRDLTRLARPRYLPAPASLLAFVALQCGDGGLANLALDRATAQDPHYQMARLLAKAAASGIPPSKLELPMTPEQLAEAHDENHSSST